MSREGLGSCNRPINPEGVVAQAVDLKISIMIKVVTIKIALEVRAVVTIKRTLRVRAAAYPLTYLIKVKQIIQVLLPI